MNDEKNLSFFIILLGVYYKYGSLCRFSIIFIGVTRCCFVIIMLRSEEEISWYEFIILKCRVNEKTRTIFSYRQHKLHNKKWRESCASGPEGEKMIPRRFRSSHDRTIIIRWDRRIFVAYKYILFLMKRIYNIYETVRRDRERKTAFDIIINNK